MANAINSLNFNDNIYTFTLPYGTCSTAADTAAKTVDVDNFSLEKGARVLVKFTVTNNASSPTLNVENTGAKAIYYRGSAINAGVLAANRTYEFVYNGTQWDLIGDLDANTTYGAAGTSLGLVKSGGDVTISNGVITVNDDSHNHIIDNIDGLQNALNEKSYYKPKYIISAGDGNTHYYKLFTITPLNSSNSNLHYVFDVTDRDSILTKFYIYTYCATNEKYFNNIYIYYDGTLGAKFTAYRFKDTTNKVESLEIWGTINPWGQWKFFPKTYNLENRVSIEWNGIEATALPTNATSTVTISLRQWYGNAATATKLGTSTIGSSSQPIYLSAGTPTKISAIGTAYGGTGATSVSGARSNLEVYSKTEVDNKVIGVKNDLLNGAGPAYDTLKELGVLIDENTDAIDALETIAASKLPISGGTMTGDIKFTKKGITYVPGNTDQYLWKVYSNEDGKYGYRLQYNGTAEGNENTLVLIADNQESDEVNAVTMYQDGTTIFAKRITASGGITGTLTGNATTATSATKATQDGSGNNIVNTYATKATVNTNLAKSITGLSVSGQTITYTKGDGSTGTITTQDTNTTYTFNGAVSTIKDNNLTANRALISNGPGKVAVSDITSTELGYLDGVTSNIQTQLNTKLSKSGGTMTGQLTFSGIGYTFGASGYTANYAGNWTAGASAGSWNIYKSDGTTNVFQLMFGNGNIKTPGTVTATGGFVGNASSATKLATKRTINGTDFDGSGNITTSSWGTARTLKIGDKSQSVNGSQDISWSLEDIGAIGKYTTAIVVKGDTNSTNIYYPVVIKLSTSKDTPTYFSIWKDLGSPTPSYEGNHEINGTSSMWIQYEGRNNQWDGNGGYLKTLDYYMDYANLCAKTELGKNGSGQLIIWLRGGGTSGCAYNISSTRPITYNIYYKKTLISGSADNYPVYVEPTTTVGNKGIYSTRPIGYGSLSGNATTATKLAISAKGSATQPVYFSDEGKPVACTYTLNKSVPANAVFTDTTYSAATTSASGLMTADMVTKLNGIATGANKYILPNATSSTLGGVKIGSNITVSSGTISLTKENVTAALGYTPPTANTTYSIATASAAGLVKPISVITKPTINSTTTTSGRYYSIQMSSDGNMFVNVPWGYSAATTSVAGLMSAEDKKRLDSVVGLTPLSTPNRTIAELRTALDNWLNTHKNFAHATAIFSGSADWINKWNNEDLTTAFSPGGKWTVTVIASYSENTYVHLRFAYYNDQDIVYVVKNNNVWQPARKVAFKNKLSDGTVGSSSKPIYLNNGVPTECGTLSLSTTGNAATATKLSIVSGGSSQNSTNLYWQVYEWEINSSYGGCSATYNIVDSEQVFNGILSIKIRNDNSATSLGSHKISWLSANRTDPPKAVLTYTINSNSITYRLYIAHPSAWTSLTIAKINEIGKAGTLINEKVTSLSGSLLAETFAVQVTHATTASGVLDSGNGKTIKINYSADALSNPTWLAGWNGYELRGVNRNDLSVNYATSAGSATTANNVSAQTATTNANRHVWFSDSTTETKRAYDDDFKYNPSTNVLTVGSITGNAASATIARTLGNNERPTSTAINAPTATMRYDAISASAAGVLPVSNNANGIITLNTHEGHYQHQLGFSSDGSMYRRAFIGTAIDTTTAWKKILDSSNYSSYALPLSGGTLSGKLTASGKISVPTSGSAWISGMTTGNASIAISTQNTSGSYHPIIAGKTYNGHIWNLGTYVDNIGFYGFKSGRTENATDWSFTINVSSGAINASGSITATSFHGSGSELTSLNASKVSSGVLAVARGGTGITSNPSMLINLGSTSAANVFATSPRPGITGTLGLANGGTGKTTAKDAANAFINALDIGSSAPVDADYYICQYAGGGTSTITYHRRPTSALWTYMKGKIDTTYYKTVTKSGAIGSVTLADKTDYIYTGVTSLTLVYPSGNFECWLSVTTSTSAITLSFPSGTKFIGASITSLAANTTYEISIKNKVAIIKKVG